MIQPTPEVRRRREELRRARIEAHRLAARDRRPAYSERVTATLKDANKAQRDGNTRLAKVLYAEAWRLDREDLYEHWRDQALTETMAIAEARGEVVEYEAVELKTVVRDEDGAKVLDEDGSPVVHIETFSRVRLGDRGGGLEHALDKGWLDHPHGGPEADALYAVGEKYRDAYEVTEGRKSNQGGAGGGFGPKGPQLRIVEAGEFLAVTRAPLTSRQRRVLDLVCGDGHRCRRAAAIMQAGLPATTRALRGGLSAALEAWEEARRNHEIGEAGERVRRVTGLIRRAR